MSKLEVFNKLLVKKSSLLKCIFSTLIFQILITSLVFSHIYYNTEKYTPLIKSKSLVYILVLFGLCIGLLIAMTLPNISFTMRFILFMLFSVLQGFILGVGMKYVSKEIIISALVSTIAIFSTFLGVGFLIVYKGINLAWIGIYLLYGLLGLIITNIVSIFIKPNERLTKFSVTFGLLLFSLYILYDTNKILLKYSNTNIDCIRGALEYYFDILNIFTHSVESN